MPPRLVRSAAALACLLLAAARPGAQLFVVDQAQGPGHDFADLSSLALVPDGATVLVRSGGYGDVSLLRKGVTLVAEEGASVSLESLDISFNERHHAVWVQGLTIHSFGGPAVELSGCRGPVTFEDCSLRGELSIVGSEAMVVATCDAVTLTRCVLEPPSTSVSNFNLRASNSTLYVYETTVHANGPSRNGAFLDGGFLLSSGSTFLGGDGRPGLLGGPQGCTDGADGGIGLFATDLELTWLDSTALGGAAGVTPDPVNCDDGQPGAPMQLNPSVTFQPVAGSAAGLALPSPVRSGVPFDITVSGGEGDLAWLAYATDFAQPLPVVLPAFDGALHLQPPTPSVFFGVLPAGGELSFSFTLPATGLDATELPLQPVLFSDLTRRIVLGNPADLVLLAPGL